jgi:hypothetical protein
LSAVIAEKLRLNDEALIFGMAPEVGELVVDGLLLPQAAATRAAHPTTAERAIVLLALKTNETTSFVRARRVHKWDVTDLLRFGVATGDPMSG